MFITYHQYLCLVATSTSLFMCCLYILYVLDYKDFDELTARLYAELFKASALFVLFMYACAYLTYLTS